MSRHLPSILHLRLPFRAEPFAVLEISGQFPVTEHEWDVIMTILRTMKPGLVEQEPADEPV